MHSEQQTEYKRILSEIHERIQHDNLRMEELFDAETAQFLSVQRGGTVSGRDVSAALVCRHAGRMDLLQLLHEGKIHAAGYVDLDEPSIGDLIFRV